MQRIVLVPKIIETNMKHMVFEAIGIKTFCFIKCSNFFVDEFGLQSCVS